MVPQCTSPLVMVVTMKAMPPLTSSRHHLGPHSVMGTNTDTANSPCTMPHISCGNGTRTRMVSVSSVIPHGSLKTCKSRPLDSQVFTGWWSTSLHVCHLIFNKLLFWSFLCVNPFLIIPLRRTRVYSFISLDVVASIAIYDRKYSKYKHGHFSARQRMGDGMHMSLYDTIQYNVAHWFKCNLKIALLSTVPIEIDWGYRF